MVFPDPAIPITMMQGGIFLEPLSPGVIFSSSMFSVVDSDLVLLAAVLASAIFKTICTSLQRKFTTWRQNQIEAKQSGAYKMEDPRTILEEKLPVVLDIILTRPNQLVDDTYIEKLLTWLNTIASEKDNGDFLLNPKTNISQFLLSEPDRLFESPICANFALRLVGLVGGSSSNACKMLIDEGILENLFGRYQLNESVFVKSALTRFAFFEGISSMLGNSFAYSWVLEKNGMSHIT